MADISTTWTVCEPSYYEMPGDILSATDFFDIVPFFMYRAVPKSSSTLSWDIPAILGAEGESRLYDRMMNGHEDKFNATTRVEHEYEWAGRLKLADQNLKLDCEKGIYRLDGKLSEDKNDHSNNFENLVRHIRNSIAHGRMRKEKDFLLLEDHTGGGTDKKGNPKPLTARIIIRPQTLSKWTTLIKAACIAAQA